MSSLSIWLQNTFDGNDAESIRQSKKRFARPRIKTPLAYVKANFAPIVVATAKVETPGLPLNESMDCIESIHAALSSLHRTEFEEKLDAVLRRNRGLEALVEIRNVLHRGEESSNDYIQKLSPKELQMFKFYPVTSCDVERSFSHYGSVFTEKRHNLTFDNLKKHLIVYANRTKK